MDAPKCPDCDVPMEAGFIPDASFDRVVQTCWYQGKPEIKKFLGMKVSTGSIDYDVDKMIGITAYRCPECGLLRFYALKND